MHKRIFTLFVLVLFLTPSVVLSQETSPPPESLPTEPTSPLPEFLPTEPTSPPPTEQPKIEQPSQPPQQKCPPEKACMKGEDCVPCPGQEQQYQPQPGQYQPPQENKFEGCPPKPLIPCSPDQKAEPNFDERGCVRNWKCMGVGTASGSQINVPQGCKKVENEFSVQIVCEQDQRFSNFKADKEKSCVQSGGKFYVREDGSFDCSFEGKQGFFNPVECPTHEQSKKIEQECRDKGGQEEYFMDGSGCYAINCKERTNQQFQNEDEKIKFKAIACEESGGQFIMDDQSPRCMGAAQSIRINKELKPLDGIELLKIALEMENIIQAFHEISTKLESLQNYYQSRGDEEKAKAFGIAISQMDGALTRLDEIRIGLAENADNLQEGDRYAVLEDMQQINSIIKDVAVTLLTGGKSKRAATQRFERKAKEREFETPEGISPEQGMDILQAFRDCASFSEESPFEFSPEQGVIIKLQGLKDGKCVMYTKPEESPVGITFLLPSEVYQFFDNPHLLLRDDVECSPEFACDIMKEKLKTGEIGQMQAPQTERFGERERKIKYGIEYGILGCNDFGSENKLNQECQQQGEIACKIEVPGCGNWIVCESSQDKCPPRDYCKLKPEACPGPAARGEDDFDFRDFEGPQFPERENRFKRLQQEFPGESKPSPGELRPSQCDAVGFTNEECAKWAVENLNAAGQGPCIGLDKEQCVLVLKKAWDKAFEDRGFASNAVKEINQFIRGE